MKHFTFLATFLLTGVTIYAQDSSVNLRKSDTFRLPDFKSKKVPFKYLDKLGTNNFSSIKSYLKPGIYLLPLDNMPCSVPEIAGVSKIPYQQSKGSAIRIPNKISLEEVK